MSTKIEWAEDTWNPFTGCSKISSGCMNCYAEKFAQRFKGRFGYPVDNPFKFTFHPERLLIPGRWRRRKKVFVCSMSDLFYSIDGHEQNIIDTFHIMDLHRQHIYMILTKRIDNMQCFFNKHHYDLVKDYPHVWLGITIENQEMANYRMKMFNRIPAAVKYVSIEPMLSRVDLFEADAFYGGPCGGGGESGPIEYDVASRINWVICGGEKTRPKKNARRIEAEWVRFLRDQCTAVNVPFFFKQWGEWAPNWYIDDDGHKIEGSEWMDPMGHRLAGRKLDGIIWDQCPEVTYEIG